MIIRPRLNDHHGILLNQHQVDFAIPFLDEDIPLYLDPFLLWKSPSQQDNSLHTLIISSFNQLGNLYLSDEEAAIEILKFLSECDEAGLGNSESKKGQRIGDKLAHQILSIFKDIPQVHKNGLNHIEEIQLLIEGFSKDRISDIACNLIKSFLIDYTIQQCEKYGIPMESTEIHFFDTKKSKIVREDLKLPVNPTSNDPILLIPKRWLRFIPWLSFDDYFTEHLLISAKIEAGKKISRIEILEYNRKNYDQVIAYVEKKQRIQEDCKNDPLFTQIPVLSSRRKLKSILSLPTGKTDNADKDYENILCPLLVSILYPDLDFASTQSRTASGVLIRDLIFYNNTTHPFLQSVFSNYGSNQIVFELKNVLEVSAEHVNQLNRYLKDDFGHFGILFTRNKPPASVFKNTLDLWSGQRRCILILDDSDLELMCQTYEDKQRMPIDVINKKYVEFIRACPS